MPGYAQDQDGYDEQDQAEAMDETVFDEDHAEQRTFEELPDLFDDTRRDGDADEDEAVGVDAAEFDAERDFDADELEADDESREFLTADETDLTDETSGFDEDRLADDGLIDGLDEVADADTVSGGEDDFTNFQSRKVADKDLRRMGYADSAGRAKPPS